VRAQHQDQAAPARRGKIRPRWPRAGRPENVCDSDSREQRVFSTAPRGTAARETRRRSPRRRPRIRTAREEEPGKRYGHPPGQPAADEVAPNDTATSSPTGRRGNVSKQLGEAVRHTKPHVHDMNTMAGSSNRTKKDDGANRMSEAGPSRIVAMSRGNRRGARRPRVFSPPPFTELAGGRSIAKRT